MLPRSSRRYHNCRRNKSITLNPAISLLVQGAVGISQRVVKNYFINIYTYYLNYIMRC